MSQADDTLFVLEDVEPSWISVSAIQCSLRTLFTGKAPHRAAALALAELGQLFEADYAVMHARFGVRPLSEEWSRPAFALSEQLRDQVNDALLKATEFDEPRCVRIGGETGSVAIMSAVLYGENAEQAGCVGLLFRDCSRTQAYELLVQFEAMAGFLSLLLTERSQAGSGRANSAPAIPAAGDPLRMVLDMVTELRNRHALDQIAVGIVDGHHVRVALVNDALDVRASNPGVASIRDAMVECLDAGRSILLGDTTGGPDYRLHADWRTHRGGGVVASVPLSVDDRVTAIVSVATTADTQLTESTLQTIHTEMERHASLLPVARLATRSLPQHARDVLADRWKRTRRHGKRLWLVASVLGIVAGWLAFGTIPYSITVPCTVRAVDRRIVSSPRGGILAELYVRPGDQVTRGQLMAEMDSHADSLTRAELEAEIGSLDAQIDVALGENDTGRLRVLEAQRNSVLAKISVVAQRIEHAYVRAPMDGIVLAGELREKLGARLAMGESMFELARYDGAIIEMLVPEAMVIAARDAQTATFIAAATPDTEHELEGFRLAPAASVVDGNNVFVAEANLSQAIGRLPPGMEGYVVLDVGPRRASWVLTHRVLDWLRLNFWL